MKHLSLTIAASLLALLPAKISAQATISAPVLAPVAPAAPAATPSGTGPGVVTSADPRATLAGQEMLRQGGSATDAALAMLLALTVVEPQSSGIGGGGFFLHHDAASGVMSTIDGREKAPRGAVPTRFLRADGTPMPMAEAVPGGLSVGVPGNIALMASAHKRWGKLPWARLFDPAIKLADEGYVVNATLAAMLSNTTTAWEKFPETRAIYYIDGRPARAGERIRNPQLAALLREIAARGPDAFYRGQTATAISAAVAPDRVRGAVIDRVDMAAYRAKDRAPLCMHYRIYKICGMGPPSSGGTTVLGILGMLEPFDMKAMGKDNPMSWHLIAEAMRLSYADRDAYLGDPDFVDVPAAGLVDKNYLRSRSRLISPFGVLPAYLPGNPPGAQPRTAAKSGEITGTTHFVAVDGRGEIVSMTSTVEGLFGSQLVARGMILNNELTDFTLAPEKDGAPVANRVQGNKRPRSSMSPTIVYGPDGKPVLALGSAGGPRIIMHVAKTLIGVLDWGLPARDAIALPNIYMAGDGDIIENTPMGQRLATQVAVFGRTTVSAALGSKVNAAQLTAGGWQGAPDPRSPGTALRQ